MFKKRLTTLTAVLAMTSMFACSVSAAEWNNDGGKAEVEGSNTVVEAAIEVELPGDLMFGLNPLRLTTEDPANPEATVSSQIVTGQYAVINYSNVPVVVSASTAVTAKQDVELTQSPTKDTNTGELEHVDGKKSIYLVQEYPTDITVNSEGVVNLSVNGVTIDNAIDSSGAALDTANTTDVIFSLAKWGEQEQPLPANVGGFKFGGALDPNAGYAEEDITLKTTYTLTTVTEQQAQAGYTPKSGCFETVVEAK